MILSLQGVIFHMARAETPVVCRKSMRHERQSKYFSHGPSSWLIGASLCTYTNVQLCTISSRGFSGISRLSFKYKKSRAYQKSTEISHYSIQNVGYKSYLNAISKTGFTDEPTGALIELLKSHSCSKFS